VVLLSRFSASPHRQRAYKIGSFRDGLAILPAAFGHEAGTVRAAALAMEEAVISVILMERGDGIRAG